MQGRLYQAHPSSKKRCLLQSIHRNHREKLRVNTEIRETRGWRLCDCLGPVLVTVEMSTTISHSKVLREGSKGNSVVVILLNSFVVQKY